MKSYRVGVIGATGTVGRRLCALLDNHPFFKVTAVAASSRSAGKTYFEAVAARGGAEDFSRSLRLLPVLNAETDLAKIAAETDFVFFAANMEKNAARALEERYAKAELPVISNHSANRFTPDVPMVIPEVNPGHLEVIPFQRRRLGTRRGFIAAKSNCSIQTFVPLLEPLRKFGLRAVAVCTYQAVSGAGKALETMPGIYDNVIPYIAGEEEKSETEPLKIWGTLSGGVILPAASPTITAQCVRVPVSDGHTAAVFVSFGDSRGGFYRQKPSREDIISAWEHFQSEPQRLKLPSAPERLIRYFREEDRPQPRLDRMTGAGMSVCAGRLREDPVFDYKFISLAHNSLRGAAGGSVLLAELLAAKGYFD